MFNNDFERYIHDEYINRFHHITEWMKNNIGDKIKIDMFVIHDMSKKSLDALPSDIMKGIKELMKANLIGQIYEIDIKMYDFFSYILHEGLHISFGTNCACKETDTNVRRFSDI